MKRAHEPLLHELRTLGEFVRSHSCRMGIVVSNDRQARLYREDIVGLPFATL